MTRIGLVLGGGGVVGQAYHSGVLAVLQHDFGFDARDADVIVGTSAGSITGTLLRLGVSPEDLAAWTVKAPLSSDDDVLQHLAGTDVPELAPLRPRDLLGRPAGLPSRHMVRRAVARPWLFRPLAAGLALLAPGRHDIVAQLAALRELGTGTWPQQLWITAVRRRDGRRVVFGRPGSPRAPLHLAVAASCSVPGYFAPVEIGGTSHVDRGGPSPTNPALPRGGGRDPARLVSPMGGPPGRCPGAHAATRRGEPGRRGVGAGGPADRWAPLGAPGRRGPRLPGRPPAGTPRGCSRARCARWSGRACAPWCSRRARPSSGSWATT